MLGKTQNTCTSVVTHTQNGNKLKQARRGHLGKYNEGIWPHTKPTNPKDYENSLKFPEIQSRKSVNGDKEPDVFH